MPSTAVVWLRRDLRVHDHPGLVEAVREHDHVVPVFVLDPALLGGRFPSPSRAAFLFGCLREVDGALRERRGALVVREGDPRREIPALAAEAKARAVYWASDVSPYARARDRAVTAALGDAGVEARPRPGNFAADINAIRKGDGGPYAVFTPFHRAWERAHRRPVHRAPAEIPLPGSLARGRLPAVPDSELGDPPPPGEAAARAAMERWLDGPIARYEEHHDRLAGGTSMLSPHLHFGTISARELDERAATRRGDGPAAFRRQLAWRDFYAHVLLHNPENARLEYQERYRDLEWDSDDELLEAWRDGRTGYPVVDAAMRQLRQTGWMHNRARLVVGSFLTKDLHLDWRAGEAHFMRYLLDGDEANNNGNWQWISSVGVDPAPYFRRMLNPVLQQERFDPDGEYVRRWVPELRDVPAKRLAQPWRMSHDEQEAAGCRIGEDYPAPVVDHARERHRAIERYRAAGA